jgi:hypothetical protein
MNIALDYAPPTVQGRRHDPATGWVIAGLSLFISLYSACDSLGSAFVVKYGIGCGSNIGRAGDQFVIWGPAEIGALCLCHAICRRSFAGMSLSRISVTVSCCMWLSSWLWAA